MTKNRHLGQCASPPSQEALWLPQLHRQTLLLLSCLSDLDESGAVLILSLAALASWLLCQRFCWCWLAYWYFQRCCQDRFQSASCRSRWRRPTAPRYAFVPPYLRRSDLRAEGPRWYLSSACQTSRTKVTDSDKIGCGFETAGRLLACDAMQANCTPLWLSFLSLLFILESLSSLRLATKPFFLVGWYQSFRRRLFTQMMRDLICSLEAQDHLHDFEYFWKSCSLFKAQSRCLSHHLLLQRLLISCYPRELMCQHMSVLYLASMGRWRLPLGS